MRDDGDDEAVLIRLHCSLQDGHHVVQRCIKARLVLRPPSDQALPSARCRSELLRSYSVLLPLGGHCIQRYRMMATLMKKVRHS
jgi:hypothetical protein